jgi:hypothetical protein
LRNHFLRFRNCIQLSSIQFLNRCYEFPGIPESPELIPHPEFLTDTHTVTFAIYERFRYPIPDPELDGISGNFAEFRPIPESPELIPHLEFLTDTHTVTFAIYERFRYPIPELNGIELDAIPESMELIPGVESIPQCSTSRNRMTARVKAPTPSR